MKRKLFATSLGLLLYALAPARAQSAVSPVVLNIQFASPDAEIHIGSTMTVYMAAILPTNTLDVTVTASAVTNITLGSSALSALAGQTIYITDGIRVWVKTHLGGATITVGDGDVQGAGLAAPYLVGPASYVTLANQAFRAYTGTLVLNSDPGSPIMKVDLGGFDYVELVDSGPGPVPDSTTNDGIWTGLYYVPDLGFSITDGHFYGYSIVSGVPNATVFQSQATFDLDGIRPNIEVYNFSTSRTNMNGVMYLSSLSQGTSTPNPSNTQGRFDITVNKRNTTVRIHIEDPLATYVRDLPPMVVTASSTNLNGWLTWDGNTNAPASIFVPDGVYTASLGISDHHGVQGVTRTTLVRVISMKMQIKNISLTPSSLTSEPKFENATITRLNYQVELSNDSSSSLAASLRTLGWFYAGVRPFNNDLNIGPTPRPAYDCLYCTVWAMPETRFLNPDGSEAIVFPGLDGNGNRDHDREMMIDFRGNSLPGGFFRLRTCDWDGIGEATSFAQYVTDGDGDKGNDYELINLFNVVGGTNMSPTQMRADMGVVFIGDTPSEGTYRLQIRTTLTGMDVVSPGDPVGLNDTCTSSICCSYANGHLVHFIPTARPEGYAVNNFGQNIYTEDTSVFFAVNKYQPPLADTTPPFLVSSDPLDQSEVAPNLYSTGKPVTAQIQDNETPINILPNVTYARLFDPQGAPVGGNSTTNGGGSNNTATLVFAPFSPLKAGGDYILQVNACNQGGLCIQRNVTFKIRDQTPPDVVGVELYTATSLLPNALALFQTAPSGPYDNVTEIWAQLAMPPTSSNTIDWSLSNLAVNRIVSGTVSTVPVTRTSTLAGPPSDGKIKFRLISPIVDAGLFEVVVQSFSKDAQGQGYSGPPAPWTNPRFTTVVNSNVLTVKYADGIHTAVSGVQPITVTVVSTNLTYTPTSSSLQAVYPSFSGSLAPPAGFQPLTATASMAHALQFNLGFGALTSPLRWLYQPLTPVRFTLYYNDTDLPPQVTSANLVLMGHDGTSWQSVVGAVHTSTNGTDNTFAVTAPLSLPAAYAVYAIFYPVSAPNITPSATPTPNAFPLTRSFSPVHKNPLFRLARFYYADALPKDIEARIYDTSGQLIRALSLGNGGIRLTDVATDAYFGRTMYFFIWDGKNDTGNLVKNGVYLVRWKLARFDGSSDTQVRPVALIK